MGASVEGVGRDSGGTGGSESGQVSTLPSCLQAEAAVSESMCVFFDRRREQSSFGISRSRLLWVWATSGQSICPLVPRPLAVNQAVDRAVARAALRTRQASGARRAPRLTLTVCRRADGAGRANRPGGSALFGERFLLKLPKVCRRAPTILAAADARPPRLRARVHANSPHAHVCTSSAWLQCMRLDF